MELEEVRCDKGSQCYMGIETNKEGRMSDLLGLCGECVGFCRSRGGMLD